MKMKKNLSSFTLVGIVLLLTGCGITSTHTMIKKISQEPLADGSVTKIGYIAPSAEWRCRQLDRKSGDWGAAQFKGMIKMGGGYEVLQSEAIAYANQRNLKPNYIYLQVPDELEVNGFNIKASTEASANYYQCKYPPALYNKMF